MLNELTFLCVFKLVSKTEIGGFSSKINLIVW